MYKSILKKILSAKIVTLNREYPGSTVDIHSRTRLLPSNRWGILTKNRIDFFCIIQGIVGKCALNCKSVFNALGFKRKFFKMIFSHYHGILLQPCQRDNENFRPEGHIMLSEGCIMPPEGPSVSCVLWGA